MANTFLNKYGLSHLVSKLKTYIASQISAHTSNKSNPHGVTKSQVGLGSVANIDQSKAIKSITRSGTTFTATALDGTKTTFDQQDSNTTYGVATSSANGLMSASDKAKLDSHLSNKSNPHGVTAAQVGALPLSGGTMGGTAVISFPDSGNWGKSNSGVTFPVKRGGFSWTGQSDGIELYAEETNNDDLNLVLKFTDDNSNKLSIRNNVGNETASISATGVISGTFNIKSTVKSFTLSASSWSSGSYTIIDSLITASSNQEILPAISITTDQMKALQKANIIDSGQSDGSLTLKALGTVPTIDIPIRVIFRGTI